MKFVGSSSRVKQTAITIDDFSGGNSSLVSEARMSPKFATQSTNLIQVEDGLWKTRWGTAYYGAEHTSTIDGAQEYVKSDGTTELVTISNGKAYKSTDGGALTEITGATFTAGVQCYFMQIAGYLYIANGTDDLARYNGSVLSKYTQIDAPANLTASRVASGLTSGIYTYYAQVTALNDVGETTGSTEASITVNKTRDNWVSSTDKITWSWNASSGATRYQLYISDQSGYEVLVADSGVTNFTDDGTSDLNSYIEVPDDNTTGAPKFISMALSGNRIWATNNSGDKYKVYFSGTGSFIGNFSDFYGGGWINLEKGGRETPVAVKHYQSGTGDGRATVLAKTPDGRGAIWQITIDSATVGDSSFSVPSAIKVVGSFGTESVLGVVNTPNNLAFPNRKGWFDLGSQKNYYGVLRTNEKSQNIRPYWRGLSGAKMNTVCAYYYDAKIFISVPTSSSGNDRIVVWDDERSNWSVDWSFGAKQFLEYTTTGGDTKFLCVGLSGTKLVEISENILNDFGTAFTQAYLSPLLPVSKVKTDVLNLKESILEVGNPRGVISFQVLGIGKDNAFSTVATATITNFGSNTGIGTDLFGECYFSETQASASGGAGNWAIVLTDSPSTFTQSSVKKAIKKRAKLYNIQYKVSSSTADTVFTIQSIQSKGTLIGRKLPSSWT
jgi:hypothetical protein